MIKSIGLVVLLTVCLMDRAQSQEVFDDKPLSIEFIKRHKERLVRDEADPNYTYGDKTYIKFHHRTIVVNDGSSFVQEKFYPHLPKAYVFYAHIQTFIIKLEGDAVIHTISLGRKRDRPE